MSSQITVHDLLTQKGSRKWLQVHVDSGAEAAAAPQAFVSAGMPHGCVASPDEAIREGFRILSRGANAVYCSHPRHSKKYADFAALEAGLQAKRIEAFRAFGKDVETGAYPQPGHQVRMDAAALDDFLARAG